MNAILLNCITKELNALKSDVDMYNIFKKMLGRIFYNQSNNIVIYVSNEIDDNLVYIKPEKIDEVLSNLKLLHFKTESILVDNNDAETGILKKIQVFW